MKLDQLTYFLETAKKGHLGKAARALHVSPSAVSHSIKALEEELGRQLFERTGNRIVLTEHGKILMEKAERLVSEISAMKDELSSATVGFSGHFRLGSSHWLSSAYVLPAWSEIQKVFPKLTVEFYSVRSGQVVSGVLSGEFDFGICFSPQPHPELTLRELYQGNLILAVRKDHPVLKVAKSKRLSEMQKYPAILPKAFQGIDVCEQHPVLQKFGIKPVVNFVFDNYEIAVKQLADSDAWSFLPDRVVKDFDSTVKSVGQIDGWVAPYTVSGVMRKDRLQTQLFAKLFEAIKDRFSDGK